MKSMVNLIEFQKRIDCIKIIFYVIYNLRNVNPRPPEPCLQLSLRCKHYRMNAVLPCGFEVGQNQGVFGIVRDAAMTLRGIDRQGFDGRATIQIPISSHNGVCGVASASVS